MREVRIRTFIQLELESCLEEINWMVRCHNCEALNCPQEEYPARPLPIPPNYINNLQRRLIKVKKRILPPTLKMIKMYCPPPASSAPKTPTTVQPDDALGGHRYGENSAQERRRASEEEKQVVANGTPSKDEGGDFISQTEVGTDYEPLQLADRDFELVFFRQQKGTTTKSTYRGGDYPNQADFAENTSKATAARVAAREEAVIGQHRQGTSSTDENMQYDPGRRGDDPLISASWLCLCCMLCCAFFCFVQFPIC